MKTAHKKILHPNFDALVLRQFTYAFSPHTITARVLL